MSTEKISKGVEAIELEAEKILEDARTRANEILLKAREEVKKISSSQMPVDEVKPECDKIIDKAKVEADGKIKDSEKKASEISAIANKKIGEITQRVVNIVVGRS